ncbi:hypothetical protein HM1_0706 [Heliomicrobium modesticaldum Ice1]|uniref:Uncharacterized protein n=1 Tax=Heliobacterium modesticaldum (strain ATCC 51547 / Ice1) TaxID=498761 RepID=B0TBK8_HELMI|nr:hypothetical protein HM1_0706 [Heliomicrobium modesticaldum Ice1]
MIPKKEHAKGARHLRPKKATRRKTKRPLRKPERRFNGRW